MILNFKRTPYSILCPYLFHFEFVKYWHKSNVRIMFLHLFSEHIKRMCDDSRGLPPKTQRRFRPTRWSKHFQGYFQLKIDYSIVNSYHLPERETWCKTPAVTFLSFCCSENWKPVSCNLAHVSEIFSIIGGAHLGSCFEMFIDRTAMFEILRPDWI